MTSIMLHLNEMKMCLKYIQVYKSYEVKGPLTHVTAVQYIKVKVVSL